MPPHAIEVSVFEILGSSLLCAYWPKGMRELFWYSKDFPMRMSRGISVSYAPLLGGKALNHITVWFISSTLTPTGIFVNGRLILVEQARSLTTLICIYIFGTSFHETVMFRYTTVIFYLIYLNLLFISNAETVISWWLYMSTILFICVNSICSVLLGICSSI